MVNAIFEGIGEAVNGFIGVLSSALSGVGSMFMSSSNELTFLGSLLLIAAGVGIVYFGFRLIKGLIQRA